MRHLRSRRRFHIFLTALLVACMVLFAEARIEAITPQVKGFLELKAEEALGGRMCLSIGTVEGGLVNPISFNEITLKDKKDRSALFASVVIDSIRTNYRIWDLLFKRGDRTSFSGILSRDAFIYVNFVTRDRAHAGFVRIDGDLDDARVKGAVTIAHNEKVDFDGWIMPGHFALELKGRMGILRVYGRMSEAGDIVMSLKGEGLKLYGCTVSGEARLSSKTTVAPDDPADKTFAGTCETRRLVINGKVLPNVKSRYMIRKGALTIEQLDIGDTVKIHGAVTLGEPYRGALTILVENMTIQQILALAGAEEAAKTFAGTVAMKIELSGLLKDPRSVTRLEVRQGRIGRFDFDNLSATLKGDGPILRIEESRIIRESGSLVIGGELDVRKFGTGTAFDKVQLVSDDQAITWDAFDTTARQGTEEVRMKKRLSDDVRVGFKKYINGEKIDESSRDKDQVQLEYRLNDGDSLAMTVQDGSGFVGLQHRDKF